MARLQDFQSVTPTANDKFLIVQSQGQGLAPHTIKMDSANPTGTGALSINRKSGTTTGGSSVAIGADCTASGAAAIAEGRDTVASGNYTHAEGRYSTASNTYAHAEGNNSTASGNSSHAEGYQTTASGTTAHAEGYLTTANHKSQHVFGEYNIADTSSADAGARGNYVEIVGKGTADNARSNARTLDWQGNEVLAGGLKINGSEDVATQPKRIAFSGTTSANGNLNLGSYVAATEVIVAMTAREVNNTSNLFVCIPYQYAGTDYGFCRGAHLISETLSGSAANKNIEGYIWTMPFRTS